MKSSAAVTSFRCITENCLYKACEDSSSELCKLRMEHFGCRQTDGQLRIYCHKQIHAQVEAHGGGRDAGGGRGEVTLTRSMRKQKLLFCRCDPLLTVQCSNVGMQCSNVQIQCSNVEISTSQQGSCECPQQ